LQGLPKKEDFMTSQRLRGFLIVLTVALGAQGSAAAGIWGDFKGAVKGGIKTAWNVTKAPVQTVLNTGKVIAGRSGPGAIFDPYR
jgi:hypothetical protein